MKDRRRSSGKGTGKARAGRGAARKAGAGGMPAAAVAGIAVAVLGLLVAAFLLVGSGQPPAGPATAAGPAEATAGEPDAPADAVLTEPAPTEPEAVAPAEPAQASPTPAVASPLERGTSFDQASAAIKGPTETAVVERVVDGDTLALTDGRKVRLLGINTPERGRPLYKAAGQVLRELVEGQQVTVEFDELREDKFDRLLAYIYQGEVFVNGEIVRQGMAYTFVWPQNRAHKDELLEFQREARLKGVGLWALPVPEEAPLYVGNRRAPYFHREGCSRIKHLRDRDRVEFDSRLEALDAGMNPCVDCGS